MKPRMRKTRAPVTLGRFGPIARTSTVTRIVAIAVGALVSAYAASPAAGQMGEMPMMQPDIYTYVAFDELEYLATGPENTVEFDGELWIGGDVHRAWMKAMGDRSTSGASTGALEVQALYSRATSPFWNTQIGLRLDHLDGGAGSEARGLFAIGLEGLAPYWFEMEGFLFVSFEGDVSARVEASYETLLTQRLIAEAEVESNLAVQEVPEFGVGSGFNDVELGLRVRYEIWRELAPYVGYSWVRSFGETADLARAVHGRISQGAVVFGLHVWY